MRKIKRESWSKYITDIERDVHGRQDKAFKILKHLNNAEKDTIQINSIDEETWLNYYTNLWREQREQEQEINTNINEHVDLITMDEFLIALHHSKNKKSPGTDGINIELVKFAPSSLHIRLLNFINVCWQSGHIPEEWKISKINPIFKKEIETIATTIEVSVYLTPATNYTQQFLPNDLTE